MVSFGFEAFILFYTRDKHRTSSVLASACPQVHPQTKWEELRWMGLILRVSYFSIAVQMP